MNLVMDANALIAGLQNEPGGAVVDDLLKDEENTCYVHMINLCEVYYDFLVTSGEQEAEDVLRDLKAGGLTVREDMDEEIMRQAGRFKADFRKVSLADCFCAALANRVVGEVITSDHEFDPIARQGLCRVRFFR